MITTLEHLARRVGADPRTLRRAGDQGAIRSTRLSPRRIEVAADEERYLREHWPLLAQLRSLLRTEPNVRFAALFGSAARGDARADSDIDLLVDLADDSWERRQRLNTSVEQALDRPVDLVVLERARGRDPSLVLAALDEGRVLVDRDHAGARLRRSRPALRQAATSDDTRRREEAKAALRELLSA